MATVKLGLRDHTALEKIKLCETLALNITTNSHFADITSSLPAIEAARVALDQAIDAVKQQTSKLNESLEKQTKAEDQLDILLTALAKLVDSVAKGDKEIILSSGLYPRSEAAAIGDLPAPENLKAEDGDMEGEIDLDWKKVRGAISYVIETSQDSTTWGGHKVSTKRKFTYPGLTPGVKTWFRVAAVGAAGQGPWSDSASGRAV